MSIDPHFAPHSGRDLGPWKRWVEERLKYLASGRNILDHGSVTGGVVTVHEILTDPNSPLEWIDTDQVAWSGTGDVQLPLTALPYSRTLIVMQNGLPLPPSMWSRVGPLVTVPALSWFQTGDVFSAYYATDTVVAAQQVPGPVITTPTAGASVTDLTPTISGTGAEGRTVTVYVDGVSVGSAVVSGGAWSLISTLLTSGAHTAIAKQAEPTGTPLVSPPVTFTVSHDLAAYMLTLGPSWWDRLGEAPGTTFSVDSSGNGRGAGSTVTGVTFGATGLVVGDTDTAATWSSPGRMTLPYGSWMNSSSISGFILFKTTNTDANGLCFMSRWDSTVALLWSFDHVNGNIRLRLNGTTVTTTGLALNDGNQQMAGFTYDGTTLNLFTKAGLVKSQAVTVSTTGSVALTVGADYGGGGGSLLHHFAGTLDEAAFAAGQIWTVDNFKTLWEMAS